MGAGDGVARMWDGEPNMDLDGDGLADDALANLDRDGIANHAALDLDNDRTAESYFTDDGSGTWAVAVDRPQVSPRRERPQSDGSPAQRSADSTRWRGPRWFGLDGVEHTDTDTNGDGTADAASALHS